jgi:hypothetical protein
MLLLGHDIVKIWIAAQRYWKLIYLGFDAYLFLEIFSATQKFPKLEH